MDNHRNETGDVPQEPEQTLASFFTKFLEDTKEIGGTGPTFLIYAAMTSGIEANKFPFQSPTFRTKMRIGAMVSLAERNLYKVMDEEPSSSPATIEKAKMQYLAAIMASDNYASEHPSDEHPVMAYNNIKRDHLQLITEALKITMGNEVSDEDIDKFPNAYDVAIVRLGIPSQEG